MQVERSQGRAWAFESAIDTIQRLRAEARSILHDLGDARQSGCRDRLNVGTDAQLTRLDEISAELRRIAVKAATPDAQREAESLAALIDKAIPPKSAGST